MEKYFRVGVIANTHGIRGEVKVYLQQMILIDLKIKKMHLRYRKRIYRFKRRISKIFQKYGYS